MNDPIHITLRGRQEELTREEALDLMNQLHKAIYSPVDSGFDVTPTPPRRKTLIRDYNHSTGVRD